MKKFAFLLASLLLYSTAVLSQQIARTIYDTSDNLTSHQRGQAFAHWFVDQHFIDFQAAVIECSKLGIPLNELFKSLKKNVKEGEFPAFVQEMEYYGKQDSIPLSQFEKQLYAYNYKVKANWNELLATSKQSLWLVYTHQPNVFIVKGKDERKGIKLTSAIIGNNQNLEINKKGLLFKSPTQFSSKPLTQVEVSQEIIRRDSTEVQFIYSLSTGENWKCKLPAIQKPLPYIKTFYSNFTNIDENQRIALTWEVWGVDNVMLNSNIGKQLPAWQIMLAPESSIDYIISAENSSGKAEKQLHIDVTRTYLTKATVTYYQHKDSDAKEKGIIAVAELENIRGETVANGNNAQDLVFPNDGNYFGPFELNVTPNSILKKDLLHGKMHLSMSNNGKNTWSFSPLIVLTYSDGTSNKLLGYGLQQLTDSTQKFTVNF